MVVSDRSYRRLTRLAALAVVSMALAFAAAVLPLPAYGGLILFAIASVPVYLAIGPYQADLAFQRRAGRGGAPLVADRAVPPAVDDDALLALVRSALDD